MHFQFYSAEQIAMDLLPGPSAVLRMADSADMLIPIKDSAHVVGKLDLVFNDADGTFGAVRAPEEKDARQILDFVETCNAPNFIAQCQAGIGRSQAVVAAMAKIRGVDPTPLLLRGTYNRRLFDLLLQAAGIPLEPLPLVSLAVRVKYAPERLHLFLLSMRRQRHPNWEVVAVTDGPNPDAKKLVDQIGDARIRLIETPTALGRWGHPYRQVGLDACRGDFIGTSNDDNYYVPGYLEQMVMAIESDDADMAICKILHSYYAWTATAAGGDLGAWIARRELVRKHPWPGNEFTSDQVYVRQLIGGARKVVEVPRPLFVHN